ncbi:MAG: hypothetical protein O9972_60625 [Burkholderiales bacterium]|nr:hypothetical protein [Burkholderiales bacterium]
MNMRAHEHDLPGRDALGHRAMKIGVAKHSIVCVRVEHIRKGAAGSSFM